MAIGRVAARRRAAPHISVYRRYDPAIQPLFQLIHADELIRRVWGDVTGSAGAPTFLEQACLRAVRDSVACKLDSERRYSGGLVGSVSGHHVDADYADVGL